MAFHFARQKRVQNLNLKNYKRAIFTHNFMYWLERMEGLIELFDQNIRWQKSIQHHVCSGDGGDDSRRKYFNQNSRKRTTTKFRPEKIWTKIFFSAKPKVVGSLIFLQIRQQFGHLSKEESEKLSKREKMEEMSKN